MIHADGSLLKEGHSAAATRLQDLGAGESLDSFIKALQSYKVRNQVTDVNERGREQVRS